MQQGPEDQRSVLRSERRSNWRLRLEKELDDHGVWRLVLVGVLALVLVGAVGWFVGGSRRPSFAYGIEATRVMALDLFGGEQLMDNALDIHHEIMVFRAHYYNAFDIAATSLYSLSTQFRKNGFERVLKRENGRVRVLVLDPRLALEAPGKAQFDVLSVQLGDSPKVTFTQCLLSTFVLAEIADALKEYGDRFQVRFYRTPVPGARRGQFLLGRSYSKYRRGDPSRRFDIIVPYGDPQETGIDTPLRRTWRIKDTPQSEKVRAYSRQFETAWRTAVPLDEVMRNLPSPLAMKPARHDSRKEQ